MSFATEALYATFALFVLYSSHYIIIRSHEIDRPTKASFRRITGTYALNSQFCYFASHHPKKIWRK